MKLSSEAVLKRDLLPVPLGRVSEPLTLEKECFHDIVPPWYMWMKGMHIHMRTHTHTHLGAHKQAHVHAHTHTHINRLVCLFCSPQPMSPEETCTQVWPINDLEWTQFVRCTITPPDCCLCNSLWSHDIM